jgi:hypothetical protein
LQGRHACPGAECLEHSGTPYFCFKDIDENKPTGSIRIRVETINYFLKRYREDMIAAKGKEKSIEEKLAEYEAKLRRELTQQFASPQHPAEAAFSRGHKETIHVPLENLMAPAPQSGPQVGVSGD